MESLSGYQFSSVAKYSFLNSWYFPIYLLELELINNYKHSRLPATAMCSQLTSNIPNIQFESRDEDSVKEWRGGGCNSISTGILRALH
jgi:hypothetical protein